MEQSPLKNKIVCRLQAEHAENTSDSEITRCLSGCIAAPGLIREALKMRDAGILTSEDIFAVRGDKVMNDKVLFKIATELQADDAAMSRALRLQSRADRREVERLQATAITVQGVQDALFDVVSIRDNQVELF